MPQHEKLALLPFRFPPLPPDMPQSVRAWAESFQQSLVAWANAQASLNIQSGISSLENPSGEGYNLGWDPLGYTGFIVGDVDNASYIQWSGRESAFIFGDEVTVKQGDNLVYLAFGVQGGTARDGDAVTFSPSFPSDIVPKIIFGSGGLTFDSNNSGSDQYQDFAALNLTNQGFTMSAQLRLVGTNTTQTLNFSGGAGVTSDTVTKSASAQADDDKYTYNFNVTVAGATDSEGNPIKSSASVGVYTKASGGSFIKRATLSFINTTGSSQVYSRAPTVTVDGLGANSQFKVQVESGSATLNCDTVEYDTVTSGGSTSATPSGANAIPWLAIGTKG